jgi:serralysin
MSTPTTNSVGTSFVSTAGLGNVAALINGTKWNDGGGNGVHLTYSAPSGTANFITPYGSYANTAKDGHTGYGEFYHWYELTPVEISAVGKALKAWAGVSNLSFQMVSDNASVVGDLRFTRTDVGSGSEIAHAYHPSGNPSGGDVWFNNGIWHTSIYSTVQKGTYNYLTILHEIGHALGLKHPHEGANRLPPAYDTYSFTVMSYKAYEGGDNSADYYPTTPMWYDILAIQHLYGKGSHNAGNTTYTYKNNNPYWETIDDTGGRDQIVYKGSFHVSIDLAIGHWSDLGRTITFGNGSTQTGTVVVGPGSVIENASGGSGNDLIAGNDAGNELNGGAGRDTLNGLSKADILNGGDGRDKLNGGSGGDTLNGGSGGDTLNGGTGDDTLNGGPGLDRYLFKNAPGHGVDTITTFEPGEKFKLDNADFAGIGPTGTLKAKYFVQAHDAQDGNDHIVYQKSHGRIFYDHDGAGGDSQILFAKVDAGTSLHHDDFIVI